MGFEFKRKESVRKAVKRLGQRQIKKALRALQDCERIKAVHEVRKDIKRLRALLRLIRAAMRRTDYGGCSNILRAAAAHLAGARDAHARVNALAGLIDHFRHELSANPFPEIKRIVAADCRKEQVELSKKRPPRKVSRLLKKYSKRVASVSLKDSEWAAIAPGVKRSYRDGRDAYCVAHRNGTPEDFHEWRKRVKDLLYQVELLSPIWPEQMAAAEAELKHLADSLGNDHDLFLLTESRPMKCFRKRAEKEADALQALADLRQRRLRSQALSLGARFYEEKPSVFCKRLEEYWKRWRQKPKHVTRVR